MVFAPQVRARKNYEGDLSFPSGAIITILGYDEKGLCIGSYAGSKGSFPREVVDMKFAKFRPDMLTHVE